MPAGPSAPSPLHLFTARGHICNERDTAKVFHVSKSTPPTDSDTIEPYQNQSPPSSRSVPGQSSCKYPASRGFMLVSLRAAADAFIHASMQALYLLVKYIIPGFHPLSLVHPRPIVFNSPLPRQLEPLIPGLSIENSEAGLGLKMFIHWPSSAGT